MRRTVQISAVVVRVGHLCRRVARRERQSIQQATEADWLTRTHDSRCAEPYKTRPPSYALVNILFTSGVTVKINKVNTKIVGLLARHRVVTLDMRLITLVLEIKQRQ
jgi:hypothetical protein